MSLEDYTGVTGVQLAMDYLRICCTVPGSSDWNEFPGSEFVSCSHRETGKVNITHPELGTANRKGTKASFLTIATSLDLTGNHSLKILLPKSFLIRMEWDLGTESTSAHGPEDKNDGLSVPVKPAGILYCPRLCYRKPSITSVRYGSQLELCAAFIVRAGSYLRA